MRNNQQEDGVQTEVQLEKLPEEIQAKFSKLTRGLLTWGSPKVISAWLTFREESEKDKNNVLLAVDDVFQAIRKDLDNSNFGLSRGDLIKLYLKDPSELDALSKNSEFLEKIE